MAVVLHYSAFQGTVHKIKNVFVCVCVCVFMYYLCESLINLLEYNTVQLNVLSVYLGKL